MIVTSNKIYNFTIVYCYDGIIKIDNTTKIDINIIFEGAILLIAIACLIIRYGQQNQSTEL